MIYLSFIGNHDKIKSELDSFGATSSIFFSYKESISKIYLIVTISKTNDFNYLEIANANKEILEKSKPGLVVELIKLYLDNPVDFDLVYPKMFDLLSSLNEQEHFQNEEKVVNISSGTPTMTTCWVLLSQSGILTNSKLVQSFESKYATIRGKNTQEVNFNIDDFPKISSPSALKRQLTIVSREKQLLNNKLKAIELDEKLPELIGKSKRIREIKEQILYDIDENTHVLILGERGTGKQVVADAIWKLYHKPQDSKLLSVDCGTISKELLVSELFGHKKGAFTGAITDKKGIVEVANNRFLFLDEIGNFSMEGQNSLLRLVEKGEYKILGDTEIRNADLTIIAATNKDVSDEEIFASDLKDRFDEKINLPPLRERTEDIPLLVDYFSNIYSKSNHLIEPIMFEKNVVEKLVAYEWLGNIRELEKWIKRCARRFEGGLIRLKDLPERFITDILSEEDDTYNLPDLPLKISLNEYTELIRDKARGIAKGNMAEVDRLLNQKVGTEKQRKYREKVGK